MFADPPCENVKIKHTSRKNQKYHFIIILFTLNGKDRNNRFAHDQFHLVDNGQHYKQTRLPVASEESAAVAA